MSTLQKKLNERPDVPFYGDYNFGRENVVELSRLISMYLFNKPSNIDRDRIYCCVQACYNDLRMGRDNNPEYYYEDMSLLLAWLVTGSRRNNTAILRNGTRTILVDIDTNVK